MLSLYSPAKINLFLRVLGKRGDGYHELASLFQTVSLCDCLRFELCAKDELICSDPALPLDESNLILKAANRFRAYYGTPFGVRVYLEKMIPTCAGLGGGSSNAATTLWALNTLLAFPFSCAELMTLGAEIGSDVPFFFSLGTAYCRGRGEGVLNMPPVPSLRAFDIVKPDQGLSTKAIYDALKMEECSTEDPDLLLKSFYSSSPIYVNDLEAPALRLCPILSELKHALGAEAVFMTGSGTALVSLGRGSFIPVYRKQNSWYSIG